QQYGRVDLAVGCVGFGLLQDGGKAAQHLLEHGNGCCVHGNGHRKTLSKGSLDGSGSTAAFHPCPPCAGRGALESSAVSSFGAAMPRRLLELFLGLIAYGVSMVMMLQSALGLMPWDVLHQGIALQGDWPMGRVTIAVSFAVLLIWIPIRQKPGFGTLCNAVVIGLVFDAVNSLIGDRLLDTSLASRSALLVGGIVLNG